MNRTWAAAAAAMIIVLAPRDAAARAILHDPVSLNIGVNCQWQSRCMSEQHWAMRHALDYVARARPPHSRVYLCNRNAKRAGNRVDWIGFNHCIHNRALTPMNRTRH
jgi:hypothetical protein